MRAYSLGGFGPSGASGYGGSVGGVGMGHGFGFGVGVGTGVEVGAGVGVEGDSDGGTGCGLAVVEVGVETAGVPVGSAAPPAGSVGGW